ncbi:MAG: 3-phosphoglycerate dehydrogenase [Dictyoglomus sp. NZ13-RE01]|nr:MAG: 3-phosphoglycerate dehydrogenase [Dictyoglomus sp. NZ13-RE01]
MRILIKFPFKEEHIKRILNTRKDIEIVNSIEDAEVIVCWHLEREEFLMAKNLKWIQAGGAGIDNFLYPELVNSDVILTNASGVHPKPIAEHTFALILSFTRNIHKSIKNQMERKWERENLEDCDELTGKTMGIIGYGKIGQEIGRIAKCFGMRVLGLKRNLEKKNLDVIPDKLLTYNELDELLKESDIIVISAPLTEETRELIKERELSLMKNTAIIVNIGRGQIIKESALIKALEENRIKGALLDVTYEEPLPKESPLWNFPSVIITPHIAGVTPFYMDRLLEIFLKNLNAYPDISKMVNVVDKRLGY